MTLTPIFVVDRPVSLVILTGLAQHKGEFGILAHAFTTDNFKKKFNEFGIAKWKIGDSGIYQGKDIPYEQLFGEYLKMGVTHGIIKDYYRDPEKTLLSAKVAIEEYRSLNYNKYFKIVGVAHGSTPEEYFENYTQQKKLGFEMVAIGGLLDKIENHVRMVRIKNENLLKETLSLIREKFPDDDLFPLGSFSRSRIGMFKELGIWGSDYKGWIFRYNMEESHNKGNRFEQTRNYIETQIFPLVNKERLLILSCSDRKKADRAKAIDLYDGPAFRVIRKYLKTKDGVDVKILSAKYGLISQDEIIDTYNQKMTPESAATYRKKYLRESKILQNSYDDIFFFGGKVYRSVLRNNNFKYGEGRIGEKLSQLKAWLNEED